MINLFIDTNIFLLFLSKEGNWQKISSTFEDKQYKLFTNVFVLNELKYKWLWNECSKKLNSSKKYDIVKEIKKNHKLREKVYSDYLKFYSTLKNVVNILDVTNHEEIVSSIISMKYGLLPTDASIVASMKSNNITHIFTNDSDFEKINFIKIKKI